MPKKSVSIELIDEPNTTNAYRVLLRTSKKASPIVLGTVIDHGGWAVGTCTYERGKIDGSNISIVVQTILNYSWDVIVDRLMNQRGVNK